MDLAVDLAGIQQTLEPETRRKNIILMAGDHGITEEGVSPSPKDAGLRQEKRSSGLCAKRNASSLSLDSALGLNWGWWGLQQTRPPRSASV